MIKFMIFGISGKVHGHHFMSSSPQVWGESDHTRIEGRGIIEQ